MPDSGHPAASGPSSSPTPSWSEYPRERTNRSRMDRRHEAKLKKAPRYRNYRTETKPAPSLDDKDGRKGGENRTRAVQRRSALARSEERRVGKECRVRW